MAGLVNTAPESEVSVDILIYSPSDMDGSSTALIIPHAPALIREAVSDLYHSQNRADLQYAQAKTIKDNILLPRWH